MTRHVAPSPAQQRLTSPAESFIHEVVVPQRHELNTWEKPLGSRGVLIVDARKRRNITSTKLAPRNALPAYVLARSGKIIGGIDGKYTTLVSHQARRSTQTRQVLRQYLLASELPVLAHKVFHVTQEHAAQQYVAALSGPSVIRPTARRAQAEGTSFIPSPAQFSVAWATALGATDNLRPVDRQVDIERYLPGILVRVYVVGEAAAAAVVRVPLYVIGDGHSDTLSLLEQELQRREACGYLRERRPTVDEEFVSRLSVSPDYVPKNDAVVVLTPLPDVEGGGGLSVDVLEDVSPEILELAVSAMWAFPGLSATAVDILAPSTGSADGAVVLDVDPGADLSEFVYPAYGQERRVGLAVLDQMLALAS